MERRNLRWACRVYILSDKKAKLTPKLHFIGTFGNDTAAYNAINNLMEKRDKGLLDPQRVYENEPVLETHFQLEIVSDDFENLDYISRMGIYIILLLLLLYRKMLQHIRRLFLV